MITIKMRGSRNTHCKGEWVKIPLLMDPLIRKVNSDDTIEGLNIGNPIIIDKLCGYADDIVFIIKDTTCNPN